MSRAPAATPPDFATFGDFLKYLRRRSQLTQAELAIACGYSPPHISHLENNQRLPDQATLLALFVPALGLQDEPELVERLLELAAAARRGEPAPDRTSQTMPPPRNNLPASSTPFVGRAEELAQIASLLDDPACRLLTLTGPGGIGKTRLALQAAAQRLSSFAHGVFFVSLVGVGSPDLIVSATAEALGFSFQSALESGGNVEDTKTQLLSYLRTRNLLLVMDNFEHLLDGVGLLADILSGAVAVKILVTSREPLAVQEEWVFPVGGMEVPEETGAKPLEAYGAVQLFMQRARHVQVGFSLPDNAGCVTRICQQVEGLPLGIELAAGLLRAIPIAEIAGQIGHNIDLLETSLRDVPERHRSLRAMFEQSWGVLAEAERAVLMRLSVFRGGFRREAAAYVTEAPFRVLLALVDKSLVRLNPSGRYDVHELLRQFAEEKLRALPGQWEMAQERHCTFYAEFVHERTERLERAAERDAAEQIEADMDNVRAAWRWAVEHSRLEVLERFVRGLHRFFMNHGSVEEGLDTFSHAAEMLRGHAPGDPGSLVFARIQAGLSFYETELRRSTWPDIEARLEQCLAIAQAHHAQWDIAYIYGRLGICELKQRRLAQARESLEKGVTICREIGDLELAATWLFNLGVVMHEAGQPDEAVGCFEQSLALAREIGAVRPLVLTLEQLGWVSVSEGRPGVARRYFQEQLDLTQSVSLPRNAVAALTGLGEVAIRQGQFLEARQLGQESLRACREIGHWWGEANVLGHIGVAELYLGNHSAAIQSQSEAVEIYRERNLPDLVAVWEGILAFTYALVSDYEKSRQLAERSVAFLRESGPREWLAGSMDTLGHALAGLGRYPEARQRFLEALTIDRDVRLINLAPCSVAGMAKVKAAEGNPGRALELLGLVLNHPAAVPDALALARSLLADLEAKLPPEVVAAGLERGKSLDLETVVADLLRE